MNFIEALESYEKWLSSYTPVLKDDLIIKHKKTKISPFFFFRATYFRWAQIWQDASPEVTDVPVVLSVGDLHVENFGTWRDQEGRLIWGVNDFDEAYPLPFTNDLLRLCVSAYLAIDEHNLNIDKKSAAKAILKGYKNGMETNGAPFVLEEKNIWLRTLAHSELKEPDKFWSRLDQLPDLSQMIGEDKQKMLLSTLPENILQYRIAHRVAGLGSLGRQRFIIIGDWKGSKIGREAKAIIPSAVVWAKKLKDRKIYYTDLVKTAVRSPDPFLNINGNWLCRRISPHCSKIELFMLPEKREEKKLLQAMGFETANIHLANKKMALLIIAKLDSMPSGWLYEASIRLEELVIKDWKISKRH